MATTDPHATPPGAADQARLDAALEALRLAVPLLERIVQVEADVAQMGGFAPKVLDVRHMIQPTLAAIDAARSVLTPTTN